MSSRSLYVQIGRFVFCSILVMEEKSSELLSSISVDYESYEWKKLDPKDEKTKKLVNEYLLWEGDFDGKKFNQGKIFK
ncbi:hypothetical protein OESDEN_19460 [Oesophagostomum dentatum]|uniref:EF-1-gamma C-terminal domain-containing protein n=1 Tax=Oesophagostomum dentatum TaxID=61180 RepID=A0A0B1SC99_OESDE|nr:hypothetical protein OESDEN_19460 [Oesophagostomum dentatum]